MIRPSRRLVLAGLALAPSGCGGLLGSGMPPPKLYTLTPVGDFPPGGAPVAWQLLVDVPVSTAALDNDRIALSRSATTVDYFADAAWTDRAPLLVQAMIVESFENSGRITAIGRESLSLRGDYVLRPELRHFEADYAQGGAALAHVQVAAKLIKLPERAIIAQQSFDAAQPAAGALMPAIVDAFDAAFHQVARQLVTWALAAAR